MFVTRKASSLVDFSLAAMVGLFGIAIGLMTLERGPWGDEFTTIAWTTPDTSPREFLRLLITQDAHPILHYGLIYLAQHAGVTDVILLRSINILGLPLVLLALAYCLRQQAANLSQTLVVWILFTSSPIFLGYFAELRCYFLLYAASIATSVIWYVLTKHIEANRHLSWVMIATWGACLTIFTNLHYFGTVVGGMLTAALLIKLAIRRLWSMALVIASVSVAAAAPALVIVALQGYSTLRGLTGWIGTTPIESVKTSLWMVEAATAKNLAAIAGAVVTCLFILEDRRKWIEFRTPVMLLGMIALFLGALILANAISPLIQFRYLIAGAGAVTFAVAILAAGSGTPVWLPAAVSVIALLLQAKTLYSSLGSINDSGWLPSARAVAQLKSECATTRIFVSSFYRDANGLNNIALDLKIAAVSYGYYAKKFGFSYENLRPGGIISASGPCPSVIWTEESGLLQRNPNADAEQALHEFGIRKIGVAELKRYGEWGALIVVRQ